VKNLQISGPGEEPCWKARGRGFLRQNTQGERNDNQRVTSDWGKKKRMEKWYGGEKGGKRKTSGKTKGGEETQKKGSLGEGEKGGGKIHVCSPGTREGPLWGKKKHIYLGPSKKRGGFEERGKRRTSLLLQNGGEKKRNEGSVFGKGKREGVSARLFGEKGRTSMKGAKHCRADGRKKKVSAE